MPTKTKTKTKGKTMYDELKKLAEALIAHSEDSFYLPCTVAFERAANPSAVLALIAENGALRKECARLAEDNRALLENPEDAL